MVSHSYSYADILQSSLKVAWTERQVLEGKDFDYSKRFLPNGLTRVDDIRCLDDRDKLKLNQIMGNAYCHIFAYVEEYIIPQALEAAEKQVYGEETRLRTLLRFAEEETNHQELFRRSIALFERGFGVKCGLIPGREEVAKVVLGKSRLCSYLLTSMIEWCTQLHYVEHVRHRNELDGLFRDLLKYHWMDEAQHAKIDSLLIDELTREISEADREKAVRRVARAWRCGRRAAVGPGRPGHGESREGRRASSIQRRKSGDQEEHSARVPLDVSRLGAGASEFRPDRGGADQQRAGKAPSRGQGAVQLMAVSRCLGAAT